MKEIKDQAQGDPRHTGPFEPVERREFLRLMGASLALGGLGACTQQPKERIFPFAKDPEHLVPGHPRFFATAMPMTGGAQPILVESHMGRPTKIEGNPEHPASAGATSAQVQAGVLGLYDPDRSKVVTQFGRISSWPAFLAGLREATEALPKDGGGLRILTETVLSPTLADQLWSLTGDRPGIRWHQFEPINRDLASAAATRAFGEDSVPLPHFDRARLVLSIGSDFLFSGPAAVASARAFAARRRPEKAEEGVRLYCLESTYSVTGANADHRLALRPTLLGQAVVEIARGLGVDVGAAARAEMGERAKAFVEAVVRDLKAHAGEAIVLAGDQQAPEVQVLCHAINAVLGNNGETIEYLDPIEMEPIDEGASLRELVADMEAGSVSALLILGGNPVCKSPGALGFAKALERVPFRVHLSLHADETSALCEWQIPETHFLEAWSDTSSFDATSTIVQPLIAPLYEGRTSHELVSALAGKVGVSSHDLVHAYWKNNAFADDFDAFWARALHDGWVPETAFEPKPVAFQAAASAEAGATLAAAKGSALEAVLEPDTTIGDGRFGNNSWLQELPKPITKLTWDNAALVSPATAENLGVASEDVVSLSVGGVEVEVPILVVPGTAEGCVGLQLGYGRTAAGSVGTGQGYDAYPLLPAASFLLTEAHVEKTGRTLLLARTQLHDSMEDRDIVRTMSVDSFVSEHESGREEEHLATLAPGPVQGEHAWAMVIDLGACTGCNACVVACQAENNIPVVGKDQVMRNRIMHWIRVDRYFEEEEARVLRQPVPCMQCEDAPCELVCPVGATVHSDEGLNDMVYNRCVGTRYCEANCPYKVRRFNFYLYADFETPSLKLQRNPDVTVRSRGVMEKCTYCVQRINATRIQAEEEGREIEDLEIKTACQQVCPSAAIVFGDLRDPQSQVSRQREARGNYSLLEELGARPRTTYLAAVEDRNPDLRGPRGS